MRPRPCTVHSLLGHQRDLIKHPIRILRRSDVSFLWETCRRGQILKETVEIQREHHLSNNSSSGRFWLQICILLRATDPASPKETQSFRWEQRVTLNQSLLCAILWLCVIVLLAAPRTRMAIMPSSQGCILSWQWWGRQMRECALTQWHWPSQKSGGLDSPLSRERTRRCKGHC